MQHFVQHDTTLPHALVQQRTAKLHGVAKQVQCQTNPGKQKKCCIVNICSVKKFDRDQTLYNKIQHDKHVTTR